MDELATKLSEAIKNGSSETVLDIITQVPEEKRRELINHGVLYQKLEKKIIIYPNVSGYYISSLGIAIINKKKEIVEMLLEHGADMNILTTYIYKDVPGYSQNHFRKDFSGDNALMIAYKMGDPEIINLLKSANIKNLSNAFLFKINLSGVDLSDSNLAGADLTNANFSGADLTSADLSGAKLTNANFSGANLTGANLLNVDLTNAIFTDAIFTDAILPHDFFYKIAQLGIPKNPKDFIEPLSEKEGSPRTQYSKRMENTQITMIGGKKDDLLKIRIDDNPPLSSDLPPPPRSLHQIFSNYSNLSNLDIKKIDCVFQTLFSLGLRNINTAKHESIVINKLGFYKKTNGVQPLQLELYLQQIFGLEKKNTITINFEKNIQEMHEYLNTKLLENTCTILLFIYNTRELSGLGHCVIAFKHKSRIYIFDPQIKTSIYSFNDMIHVYPNIDSFTVICLNEDVESKPLIVNNCTLPILLAGRKKSRKKKQERNKKKTRKNKKCSKKYCK